VRRCRSVQDPRPLYASLVLGLSGSIRPGKTMMLPREPGASFGEPPLHLKITEHLLVHWVNSVVR